MLSYTLVLVDTGHSTFNSLETYLYGLTSPLGHLPSTSYHATWSLRYTSPRNSSTCHTSPIHLQSSPPPAVVLVTMFLLVLGPSIYLKQLSLITTNHKPLSCQLGPTKSMLQSCSNTTSVLFVLRSLECPHIIPSLISLNLQAIERATLATQSHELSKLHVCYSPYTLKHAYQIHK